MVPSDNNYNLIPSYFNCLLVHIRESWRVRDSIFGERTKPFSFQALSTSALNVQTAGCYMGYCDFVRCLRRINSVNLVSQI